MHLLGHSYGGIVSMLAAARRPEAVRSLTVIEPPCFRAAEADPEVSRFGARGREYWESGPRDPEASLRGFLELASAKVPIPSPLPPYLLQNAQLLMAERYAGEAVIPLDDLGGHRSRSSSFRALIAPSSTRGATCWKRVWEPNAPSSLGRGTVCSVPESRSMKSWKRF
jgi:pimeloyl-ACP methyl ester carboxylesterase